MLRLQQWWRQFGLWLATYVWCYHVKKIPKKLQEIETILYARVYSLWNTALFYSHYILEYKHAPTNGLLTIISLPLSISISVTVPLCFSCMHMHFSIHPKEHRQIRNFTDNSSNFFKYYNIQTLIKMLNSGSSEHWINPKEKNANY